MQDQEFRKEAASLWHWVSNVCRNPDLADLAAQSTATLLHPGFLGLDYPIDGTGTLVIGMNPGGGTDTPNREERDTLVAIRDDGSVEAFDRLNSVAAKLYPSWPIWRNNLLPLLKSAKVDPATVAYIHAVPFRVADNASLAGIYASAWAKVSSKQTALLKPGRILLAGATAGGRIHRLMPVKSRIVMRSIGDKLHADRSPKIAASHAAIWEDQSFWE
ncbi:hypothetical protein SPHINGOT1_270115 [Sphingomonas sp. T1]|uniref:hypothetical protein n=1 Tax=Sphingomonas sp. T1 TaxID=2653172 RepID=UPI0012F19546|nr:hypothetical protein [Sphingomonas sp. T1]VXC98309.1 hypothetical protein SPHINGOT1_270115 [Sphingomonas sp. T1]